MAGRTILVGDVGGTKTVLALMDEGEALRTVQRYVSGDHPSLQAIVGRYLADTGASPSAACFGVAGPVLGGSSRITNLPWVLDEASLARAFHLDRVRLLNDLEALAHALPHLSASGVETLHEGRADPDGVVAVIAPGTGLGMAFVVRPASGAVVLPTEGGHTAFAPRSPLQDELLAWMRPRFGHVSVERVCSGSGIVNLYAFLEESGRHTEDDGIARALQRAPDPTPVIVDAALGRRSDLCAATLDLFLAILGGVVGDVAVQLLTRGGIYLAGGIPPRLLERLRGPAFLDAAFDKGRFRPFVETLPIRVVLDPLAPLVGAAHAV